MPTRFALIAPVALTLAGVAAAPALAASAVPTERVSYGDLDLGSAAGQRTLAERVSAATDHVCPASAGDAIDQAQCRHHALSDARARLHEAGVASY